LIVRLARDEREVAAALDLRKRVFCGEQGVSLAAERDGRDAEALHVVAVEGDRLVGTCRLVFDGDVGKLGRMAVEAGERRRGVGEAILAAAERCAREAGARRITLHAQTTVEDLYSRHGYIPHGEPFVEEGIDHVAMEKLLA
jgi:predicted GNAT family N-acyltransferase